MRNGASPGSRSPRVADQRQRLQRLAEAHVVGEDAAEPVLPQERQPAEPVALVGPQLGAQTRGRAASARAPSSATAARDLLAATRAAWLVHDAERGQLLPQPRLVAADPQRGRRRVLQRPGLLDQLAQRAAARGLSQREVRAVGEQQVRLAVRERREQLARTAPRRPSTRDRRRRGRTSRCRRSTVGGDADLQRVARVPVVRRRAVDLDDDAAGVRAAAAAPRWSNRMVSSPSSRTAAAGRNRVRLARSSPVANGGRSSASSAGPLVREVADGLVGGRGREREADPRPAHRVGPFPPHGERVPVAVGGMEHQLGQDDGRRGERHVRRRHRREPTQPGVELLEETAPAGRPGTEIPPSRTRRRSGGGAGVARRASRNRQWAGSGSTRDCARDT